MESALTAASPTWVGNPCYGSANDVQMWRPAVFRFLGVVLRRVMLLLAVLLLPPILFLDAGYSLGVFDGVEVGVLGGGDVSPGGLLAADVPRLIGRELLLRHRRW